MIDDAEEEGAIKRRNRNCLVCKLFHYLMKQSLLISDSIIDLARKQF
jgi:hypothetical protein